MNTPCPIVLTGLAVAAKLRAAGTHWEAIAARVGRHPDTCRHWPSKYPNEWNRLYAQAEDRLARDLGAEAKSTVLQLLRSKDERVRSDIGKYLINLLMELYKLQRKEAHRPADAAAAESARIAAFFDTLTDDEIEALLADFVARRVRPADLPGALAAGPAAAPCAE